MKDLSPRTEIATLGEFGLIDRLTHGITPRHDTTLLGIGDDAAAIRHSADRLTLVTTDLLLEGVHFDLTYTPLKHLGYKTAVVNFSDIYAMNGRPTQLLVALGLSKRFAVEDIEAIYDGIRHACDVYGVDLVGGDTSASLTGLTLSATCIGDVPSDRIVRRDGAHDTDLICVSGDLGAAYMGLQLLEREKRVFRGESDFAPDFAGREYLPHLRGPSANRLPDGRHGRGVQHEPRHSGPQRRRRSRAPLHPPPLCLRSCRAVTRRTHHRPHHAPGAGLHPRRPRWR